MSLIPNELKYTKEHEYVRIKDNEATIGLTDYAQNELTDVIFVEMPEVDKVVKKGEAIGAVESVKSVSEMFSPLSGKIRAVNSELEKSPELINKEPYDKGWIVIIEIVNPAEVDELLSSEDYKKQLGE